MALSNGLGQVPQMGWNTWNKFGCDISEDLAKGAVDQIIELGLDQLGYNYVNLDDCWMELERTPDGHFIVDAEAFPNGMKPLGDYIHSKGLKFGIYSSAGTMTCAGRAGSLYHEEIDAHDWASWGVDYLKYDNCYNESVPGTVRYTAMRDALKATGRDIFYSMCNWGEEESWRWAPGIANSWRTTQDIFDDWASMEYNFKESQKHFERSGPGGWNDPDMLEIGNGGMTHEEEKTHFALWAMAKAPLIIGCDLTTVSDESLAILTNKDFIAVNQDPQSTQATCFLGCDWWETLWREPQVYATTLGDGSTVATIVNWRERIHKDYQFRIQDLGIEPADNQLVQVYDLWTQEVIGIYTPEEIEVFGVKDIPGHGNFTFKFTLIDEAVEEPVEQKADPAASLLDFLINH